MSAPEFMHRAAACGVPIELLEIPRDDRYHRSDERKGGNANPDRRCKRILHIHRERLTTQRPRIKAADFPWGTERLRTCRA